MKRLWVLGGIAFFALSFGFGLSGSARAALGGNALSVQKDALALGASRERVSHFTTASGSNYSRYEISRTWIHLREFTGPGGKVFAVAWNGRRHPDLQRLLGEHIKDFQNAIGRARREGRHGGPIIVDSVNLHLEIGGHMMAVYGLIWLKNRIPSGIDMHEIH